MTSAVRVTYSDLPGKVVLVTGASAGIGRACAVAFAGQGCRVYGCDVKPARLPDGVACAQVDVRHEPEIATWIDSVIRAAGGIDVVINNAGRDPRSSIDETSAAEWDDLFALNLRAYFLVVKHAATQLRQRRGSVVNIGSVTFHLGYAGMTAYCATKGGVVGLTRSMARELGRDGIRVNTLTPGWVATERQVQQYGTDMLRVAREAQALPELVLPDEIASLALFLASDASRAVTGQTLLADKGWTHS